MGNCVAEQDPAYGLLRPNQTPVGIAFAAAGRFLLRIVILSKHETWSVAVAHASIEFRGLDQTQRLIVEQTASEIMSVKAQLANLFEAANGSEICRQCLGECCRTGCYHFTAVDLLVYFINSRELFSPVFENDTCPYLGDGGCLMDSSYRPYNCVTFVCEKIYSFMDPMELNRLSNLSETLIALYQRLEKLFANRFTSGILNNGDRFLNGFSTGILWSGNGNHK